MSEFLVIYGAKEKKVFSYENLLDSINLFEKVTRKLPLLDNLFEFYLRLLKNLLIGAEFEILDKGKIEEYKVDALVEVRSMEDVLKSINNKDWKIALYTSGTTGKPKKVFHTRKTLFRSVRIGEKYENNVWALAYNPAHIAGLQVFFQALFNKNKIVYVFNLSFERIPEILSVEKVTHISATPTFYRSLISFMENPNYHITRVSIGGERSDSVLIKALRDKFPNSKITNIYASTEFGTLFATSNSDTFYIKDEYKNYVKISEDGELLVHKSLLGEISEKAIEGDWYNTGDIVELVGNNAVRFLGRKDKMINVGGYKVNPETVEEEILKIEGVSDVLVYGKNNPVTGTIVVAEVVKEPNVEEKELESRIYNTLRERLNHWEIPRIIYFVESIDKTYTGKKKR